MEKYNIYCDMDGVLVDFNKGYRNLTGKQASFGMDPNTFWAPIDNEGPMFWIGLEWMPKGIELWNYIKKYKPNILSSPSRSSTSRTGKTTWCQIHLKKQYDKILLYPRGQKQQFAKKNAILIDDLENTIKEWRGRGGIGILHTSTEDTINQLKALNL